MYQEIEELAKIVFDGQDLVREAKEELSQNEKKLKERIIHENATELLNVNYGLLRRRHHPRMIRRD